MQSRNWAGFFLQFYWLCNCNTPRFSYSLVPFNEWLESNHWYQWFLVWQTIGSDGFSMVLVWPTIGTNGFSMVFPIETMVFQWFWVWQTIGTNGFSMVFSLETMVFQWFPMVANHWSNDGMVTIHRCGLYQMLLLCLKPNLRLCPPLYRRP